MYIFKRVRTLPIPPATATDAHVSIVGHITQDELRRELRAVEGSNGFVNRFLWVCVRRSKLQPFGGDLRAALDEELCQRLAAAVEYGSEERLVLFDPTATGAWERVYPLLAQDRPGLLGDAVARGEAQVVRLAMLYSLLDRSQFIRQEHLQAALAVWTYCEQSARYIFGDSFGDVVADTILEGIKGNEQGLTRTQISGLFSRNETAGRINQALSRLIQCGLIEQRTEKTPGRPVDHFIYVGDR